MVEEDPCPICYSDLNNEPSYAQATECSHKYCLSCIRKWAQQKSVPTCPCCNGTFENVYEIKKSGKRVKLNAKTFAKSSKNFENVERAENQIISDDHWEYDQRAGIYRNGMKVKYLQNTGNRRRRTDAMYLRTHQGYTHRLIQFIQRDLLAMGGNRVHYREIMTLTERILMEVMMNGLDPPSSLHCDFILQFFNGNHKYMEIFCHELAIGEFFVKKPTKKFKNSPIF